MKWIDVLHMSHSSYRKCSQKGFEQCYSQVIRENSLSPEDILF